MRKRGPSVSAAVLVVSYVGLMLSSLAYAQQHCTITFNNRSHFQLTMYVDGHAGCIANAGMTCFSTENQNPHQVDARLGERVMHRLPNVIPAGTRSYTYIVCEANDPTCD
jgi:hypothetical protein